jgi:DNA-binding transcriptional LysR family regulator
MANLLLSKSIDCAFCIAGDAQEPNIDCINLYHESMVVAFHNSHKFTMRDTLTISDMAEQPYIDQLNYEYRKTWLAFCKLENIKLNVVFSCEQEQWQQYLLKQGLGISLVPQYSIIDAEVNFKALANPSLTRTIALTSLDGGNCSKVVQVFLKEAAEHIWQGSEH